MEWRRVKPLSGIAYLLAANNLTDCGSDLVAIVCYCLHFDVRRNLHRPGFNAIQFSAAQPSTPLDQSNPVTFSPFLMAACVAKAAVHLGEACSCNQAPFEVNVAWLVIHAEHLSASHLCAQCADARTECVRAKASCHRCLTCSRRVHSDASLAAGQSQDGSWHAAAKGAGQCHYVRRVRGMKSQLRKGAAVGLQVCYKCGC